MNAGNAQNAAPDAPPRSDGPLTDWIVRVLLVEDNPGDARLVREILKDAEGEFPVHWVQSVSDAVHHVARGMVDVVLLDLGLPESQGIQTFERLYAKVPDMPVVVLTGLDDLSLAAEAVQRGAQDYLVKGQINPPLLGSSVRLAIERQRILLELRKAKTELERANEENRSRTAQFARLNKALKRELVTRKTMLEELENKSQELHTSNVRFYNLIQSNADAMMVVDEEGAVAFANPAAERLLGRPSRELVGSAPGFAMGRDGDRAELRQEDGSVRLAEMRIVDLAWQGRPGRLVTLRDTTERDRAGRRREFHAQVLELLNAGGSGEQLVQDLVEAVRAFTGFAAVGLRLREAHDFPYHVALGFPEDFCGLERGLREKDGERLACLCGSVIEGRTDPSLPFFTGRGSFWTGSLSGLASHPRARELAPLRPHCREAGFETLALVPLLSGEETVGVLQLHDPRPGLLDEDAVAYFEEVGQSVGVALARLRAEEALRQKEAELRQSQKMEAVGRLAGGIAHDFNNHLTVINGFAQLLLQMLPPDEALRKEVDEIRKAGEGAAGLVRRLLAFSRKQVLHPRVLDLNAVARDMRKMLTRLMGEDVALDLDLDDGLPPVLADPDQLGQILINLAANARDAMPRGGSLLLASRGLDLSPAEAERLGLPPGRYALLRVSDSGEGMSDEVRTRVFEPFFTTKPKDRGTGLGLSTVYGIVKQSGGDVLVDSAPGHGTTFRIFLPAATEAPGESRPGDEAPAAPRRGTETVLLVEDEENVRSLVRRILQQHGYRVLEACAGEEALGICRRDEREIDLVLSDVVMPGMDGADLAECIRSLRPSMRFLFMSGYAEEAVLRRGLPGFDRFLSKPFTPAGLLEKVREALEQEPGEQGESGRAT